MAHQPANTLAVTLRPVSPDDDAFLFHVYASTREDELALVDWDDAQRDAFLRMQYAAQRQYYRSCWPDADHSIILQAGAPVGRLWVARAAAEIRLLDIAVLPRYRRAGIGTFLLRGLLREAEQTGSRLRLAVHRTNTRALQFYQHLGLSVCEATASHLFFVWSPTESGHSISRQGEQSQAND